MRKSPLRPGRNCKPCNGHGCNLCQQRGFIMATKKPAKRLPQVKSKRHSQNLEYARLRFEFLTLHPRCQVLGPAGFCNAQATELHHRYGRGRFYLETSTFLATCQTCHAALHQTRRAWSRKMGYIVNPLAVAPIHPPSQTFLPYE